MASTNKTSTLKLSLWEPSDRPERLDFRRDNELLEAALGGHLADTAMHLTAAQRDYLGMPYWLTRYTGSGTESLRTSLTAVPDAVLIFCMDHPATVPGEGGQVKVYWDTWFRKSFTKFRPGLGGIDVNTSLKTITVKNIISPRNENYDLHLNDADTQYVMVQFKPRP